MGFTKLDSGIIDSSIWAEPLATRIVWVTFLAKSNRNGFVGASQSGMLRASNVPEKDFQAAIDILEAPDSDSRSKEFDGRRIEKVPGGWQILNYAKYRQFSYSDSKEAVKKRKQRSKHRGHTGDITGHVPFVPGHSASASASVLSNNKEEEKNRRGCNFNFETYSWEGITDRDMSGWRAAYPACDITVELNRMAEWLKANPEKRKTRYRRFITNWLARAQDRGGTKGGNGYRVMDMDDDARQRRLAKEMYERQKAKEQGNTLRPKPRL